MQEKLDALFRFAAAIASVASLLAASPAPAAIGFAVGDTAPDFLLEDQNSTFHLLHGGFVGVGGDELLILDFCTMWCGVCQSATLDIQNFLTQLESEGIFAQYVQVLFQDTSGAPANEVDALVWASVFGNFEPVLTGEGTQEMWTGYANAQGEFAVPTFALLDPEGEVVGLQAGWTPESLYAGAYSYDSSLHGFPLAATSAEISVTLGEEEASAIAVPNGVTVHPLTGTLSSPSIDVLWSSGGMGSLRRETWALDFFADAPLPLDVPITLAVGTIAWPDLPGGTDPGRDFHHIAVDLEATLLLFDSSSTTIGSALMPVAFDGNELRIGPFLLSDHLFPTAPQEVMMVALSGITTKALPVPEPAVGTGLFTGILFLIAARRST